MQGYLFSKELCHFHYMKHKTYLSTRTPYMEDEFHNFGRSILAFAQQYINELYYFSTSTNVSLSISPSVVNAIDVFEIKSMN